MATSGDFVYYFYLLSVWIISSVVVHCFMKSRTKYITKIRYPPGPLALPLIGHMHLLSSGLPKSLQTLASQYGPLMQIRVGSSTYFVASDAATAKEILKTHDVDFASKFAFGPTQHNIYKEANFINTPYGPYWRFMKKLCMTKLFAGSQLDRFIHIREQEALKLLKVLAERSRDGEPCDLSMEFSALTNNMICKMVMGKRCLKSPSLPLEIRKMIRDIMGCGAKFSFGEVFGPLKKLDILGNGKRLELALWQYDQLMERILKDYEDDHETSTHDQKEAEKDVVDILLETHKDQDAEMKLTRDQIKHFILEIFIASIDTTSAAMQWAMAELINHPEVFAKLRREIDTVVGPNRLLKESDVPKLPYLQAVIKEALRIHPAGPLLRRQCNIDTKINGYDVKAGTKIFINAYAIMHDPNTWKEPNKFVPERFMTDITSKNPGQHQMELKGMDVNYLPFGSGRRACLGASHGSVVLHATIGSLVQCFDWKVKGEEKVDIKLPSGFSGTMAHSLACYPIMHFDMFSKE